MLTLALLVSTLSAHADVSHFDIVKSQDGKTVVCETDSDLGRAGYRPLITTMRADGEALVLDTAVVALICAKKDGKLDFTLRLPSDPIPGTDLDGNAYSEFLSELKYLVTDANDQIIGSIDGQNVNMQSLEYKLKVASSFSKEDLGRLAKGQTLHVQWSFFLQGTHSIHQNGTVSQLGLFTGGSYDLTFDLVKQNGALKVSGFQLR